MSIKRAGRQKARTSLGTATAIQDHSSGILLEFYRDPLCRGIPIDLYLGGIPLYRGYLIGTRGGIPAGIVPISLANPALNFAPMT